ncbi:MAG: O-acetylhomoserine aminocarboxypropyltransferase/cysteine synthase, partial [Lachnospiraceae bacterium]|nr:O-acetylhomoserine aminocarboxypropyltransferase/cysteine synthase [Lachnospiraceae bacterium]
HVRMPKHCENGLALAKYLEHHPKIKRVIYSDLPGDPYHALQQKYLPKGSCGVVSFEIDGGREAAETFMNALKICAIETHVADARSCCLNPASTTHRQLTEEQLKEAGIPAGLVRFSCGLENAEDLIADVEQALNEVK